MSTPPARIDPDALAQQIRRWGLALGFQQVGICDTDLARTESRLNRWIEARCHGEMAFMAAHGLKRTRPALLLPGTRRIISVRMDYLPGGVPAREALARGELGYVSRYALGRDYHKLLRQRLQRLAERIEQAIGAFGYRVFVDSAPVMEKPLAVKAGLGWIGKHTNLISPKSGGWFFLGELFTDLELPVDRPEADHCGRCRACIDACPTGAITAPYQVDARRCISYLTIELPGAIPLALRPLIGNRIYGCDDCLLACPWNRFSPPTRESDFQPRHRLDASHLAALFAWDEATFLKRMEGSPIRRLGHQRWLRNIAVALGNAPPDTRADQALAARCHGQSDLVTEHVAWALDQRNRRPVN
ncbi:MAG: tRNA epoxyqueuosine(34) reductase QueG [Candidatus Sedimenticola endophacoides]|uniref:Epoxyqueuosine reductase n=1 Tax=Candidatus Sedimenticola endophacoides TaxID=2548426 RepID=A0A6N4E9P9_9GAMM|nr:MAG: tRNA epoxyqueuosine(34) reductase QueG [Candidatus Sedimenticola endophacoides]OQX32874.1 MAG: tRNA epoxyqueuosine(34) reductase QueG [Candidatus Sedimenticola endophacoides]OQX42635.1 MAG: tRNA epoxyqueuosine(34) reductase QueG [Candidatus Sedimenticola endophacoides]PUE03716.1 MAG: tRNA epoxyqueuosine(34) reductase QueG [Candidatus Sedimenticola endophacoides]PUE05667.1 MAG: tRNA epoxyqueuosine(34) reductase QueG [Candidatus Sedimenticola endophacoides]